MILDTRATPILERYKLAKDAEGAAISRLHSVLAAGERNEQTLLKLTEEMERAHHAAMLTYQELERGRLDKAAGRREA